MTGIVAIKSATPANSYSPMDTGVTTQSAAANDAIRRMPSKGGVSFTHKSKSAANCRNTWPGLPDHFVFGLVNRQQSAINPDNVLLPTPPF